MWSSVVGGVGGCDSPCARHKHAACSSFPFVYLFGGRQGNLPLKDFWIYDLGSRCWRQECEDKGTRPPSLQQHTMVTAHGKIFLFGGELCMSNDTPLWIYEIQRRQWRKWNSPLSSMGGSLGRKGSRGRNGPSGRRGHTAVIVDDQMIIYGGFQDLQGSTGEMWAFNIKEECWRLLPERGEQPPARHSHSAVVHDNEIWIYGGMTDLVDKGDFWKYNLNLRTWTQIRSRPNPSLLHSHVAVKLHSYMMIFGGERQGEILNDLWRFHFATGIWEKLVPAGVKPQPRTQCCAFVAPSLTSKPFRFNVGYSSLGGASSSSGSSSSSSGYGSGYASRFSDVSRLKSSHGDQRRIQYGSGYENRTCDCPECSDDSDTDLNSGKLKSNINRYCNGNTQAQPSIKQSISKISNLNLNRLGKYYSYSMLDNDSTESVLDASLASTCDSTISKLVKSQSNNLGFNSPHQIDSTRETLPRDIVSVPNFAGLQDASDDNLSSSTTKLITVLPASEDNTTHLLDDTINSKSRLALQSIEKGVSTDTNVSDTLLMFSEEQSSSCHNSSSPQNALNSFTNPNYPGFGKENQGLLTKDFWNHAALDLESVRHKEFAEVLRTPPDSGIGLCVEMESRTPFDVALATLEDFVTFDKKASHPLASSFPCKFEKSKVAPAECMLRKPGQERASFQQKNHSSTRVTFCTEPEQVSSKTTCASHEKSHVASHNRRSNPFLKVDPPPIPEGPEALYILGGKERGELTVFKRPISLWKLDLPY